MGTNKKLSIAPSVQMRVKVHSAQANASRRKKRSFQKSRVFHAATLKRLCEPVMRIFFLASQLVQYPLLP